MEVIEILHVGVAHATEHDEWFIWSSDEDMKSKSLQKPLNDITRILRDAIPVHMRGGLNFELDHVLKSGGVLDVAIIAVWCKDMLDEIDVKELISVVKGKVKMSCELLHTIESMTNVEACMVVLESGFPGMVGNIIRAEDIVCQIASSLRKAAASSKNGIDMRIQVEDQTHVVRYKESVVAYEDTEDLRKSILTVTSVSDNGLFASFSERRKKFQDLMFEKEETRVLLLTAQIEREELQIEWRPSCKWINGRKTVVGGKIVSVSPAPQMTLNV